MEEKIRHLCKIYKLGELQRWPESISGGLMHKMYRVTTNQGEYAIKVLNPDIMQRTKALQNMINSEQVSNKLKSVIPLVSAKEFQGKHILALEGAYYVIFDWLDGKSVFTPDISEYHCAQIGRILGIIHAANISIDGMEKKQEGRNIYDWKLLLEKAKEQNSECYELLQENLTAIIQWDKSVVEGWNALSQNRVISHCDLDPKNVMWKDNQPYIIDWEAAGYVNPFQELVEVLNYWITDRTGEYDKNKFSALLNAYTENMKINNVDWDMVFNCSFDGMLGWLEYNVKRALGLEGTDTDDQWKGMQQVKGTICDLKKYEARMKLLQKWINENSYKDITVKEYNKETIKNRMTSVPLLCDGAFGTYYALKYDTKELPELANKLHPERVVEIHKEYIAAGARLLRTNTYASNTVMLQNTWEEVEENLRNGYRLAKQAVENMAQDDVGTSGDKVETCREYVFVAADIGQIPNENPAAKEAVVQEYIEICRVFLEEGAEVFVFETFADIEDIRPAIEFIGDKAFVIVQFAVNQFGYSNLGLSARKLIGKAESIQWIDAVGFNCGVGPAHMQQIMRGLKMSVSKPLTAFPNAGYPQNVSNRMIFSNENINYFVAKTGDLAEDGVTILGGCCGTTPEYISRMNVLLEEKRKKWEQKENIAVGVAVSGNAKVGNAEGGATGANIQEGSRQNLSVAVHSFFAGKEGKKLIAVELAPPLGSDDEKLMDAAHLLLKSGVDVLTFPDSPSGRTRADSILMAEKVARETGMCVMPHLCCRDKNAIAMRSQLLGAHINGIHNFLIVTGDPIPMMVRSSVKSVFNFDSVGLMQIANDMNEEQFADAPICFGGAINQTRRNLDVEMGRVKKKMAAGATFFLTQPVSTKEGVERLRLIKKETGARILCGIMPFVSLKNATFMKNEMTGIEVTEEVLSRYREDMTREEGEQAGIQLAKEIIALTEDFVDGYYFSFPFNRVGMLQQILEKN